MSLDIFKEFRFHHIGLLVTDIDEAINSYVSLFGAENASEVYTLKSQGVKEAFIRNSDSTYLGLVSPINEDSVVHRMLKKGMSYYHVAYKVDNIDSSVEKLEALHYKPLEQFRSEAFNNLCVFLYTPEGHLVELIQDK